jgi:hypothetical protein
MDPTPHVGMPKRANNLEETNLINVVLVLFIMQNFASDPIHMQHRFLLEQLLFVSFAEA